MTPREKAETMIRHNVMHARNVPAAHNVRDFGAGVWAALGALAIDVADHGTHRVYTGTVSACQFPWTVEVWR